MAFQSRKRGVPHQRGVFFQTLEAAKYTIQDALSPEQNAPPPASAPQSVNPREHVPTRRLTDGIGLRPTPQVRGSILGGNMIFRTGKHKGRAFGDVAHLDLPYAEWCLRETSKRWVPSMIRAAMQAIASSKRAKLLRERARLSGAK